MLVTHDAWDSYEEECSVSLASLVLPAVLEPDVHSKDEFVNESSWIDNEFTIPIVYSL